MKKGVFLFVLLLIISACANEPGSTKADKSYDNTSIDKSEYTIESIDVIRFYALNLELNANVTVKYGEEQKMTINGPSDKLEKLQFEFKKGKATIFTDSEYKKNHVFDIELTTPGLTGLFLLGSGSADVHGSAFNQKDATLVNRGVNNISVHDIIRDDFTFLQNGAGNAEFSGEVQKANLYSNGAGNIDALNLVSQSAKASIKGAGNIDLQAIQKLNVQISGVGNVTVQGDPEITSDIKGLGKVLQL